MKQEELANKIGRSIHDYAEEGKAFKEARRRKEEEDQEFLARWRELSRKVILPIYGEVENHEACQQTEWITVTVEDEEAYKALAINGVQMRFGVDLKHQQITTQGGFVERPAYSITELDEETVRGIVWSFFQCALSESLQAKEDYYG